ncbi:hypothetical protein KP509_16G010600 [Ceratopteris richardii]|uniref:Uncharacterized protein n=1 Tax=Ceratopteris richardii TaxID=49495 RepID=A0A8T2T074_CERRI|nr:hypothetical protein KP509_16G010600 [Ceratopteris richardii]
MATLSRGCLLRQFTDCRRELVPALFERCNISRRAVTHFGGQHSNPCTLRSTFLIHRSLLVCKSVSTREAPEETEDEAALGGGQGPPDVTTVKETARAAGEPWAV